MKDKRYQILKDRLTTLSVEELYRIKDNIDLVCFDRFNYDDVNKTFCPLAIGLNLHNTIKIPTDKNIQSEISKRFVPVNALKGVKGKFYTQYRRKDLQTILKIVLKEKP